MRTKHLCVLIHIRINGEVGTLKHVLALQYFNWRLFCGSYLLFVFHVCLCYAVLSVSCSFVITYWDRTDLLALLYVMLTCVFGTFPYGVPSQVWTFYCIDS